MERGIPQEHIDLVLGYEELEGEELARAGELLRRYPELAERLARHRRMESRAAQSLPHEELFAGDDLSPGEIEEQQESQRRVLHRVATPGAVRFTSRRRVWRRTVSWAVPLAAVLALVLIWPQTRPAPDTLHGMHILPGSLAAGTRRDAGEPNTLHTGQAFAVEFELEVHSYVVVFHLDPVGRFSQVHPDPRQDASVYLAAGKHQVPSAVAESMWVLDGQTGLETFFVAISSEAVERRFALGIDSMIGTREERIAVIVDRLGERFDEVEVQEFRHLD